MSVESLPTKCPICRKPVPLPPADWVKPRGGVKSAGGGSSAGGAGADGGASEGGAGKGMSAELPYSRYPFCSERCALVDLNRWLTGAYQIPVEDDDEDESDDAREVV